MPRPYNRMPDDMRAVLDLVATAGPAGIKASEISKELEYVDGKELQSIVSRLKYDGWISRIYGTHPSVYRLNRPIPEVCRDGYI